MSANSAPAHADIHWEPNPGSQALFLSCPYDELLYHGTRGPGKTLALLMDFAQDVGQGWDANWRGILFRETYKQLADVVTKSQQWFPKIFPEAKFNETDYKWTFGTGETLLFRYIKHPRDYWNYHGFEACVAVDTPVLTPQGWRPIRQLKAGDKVTTLHGEREVIRVFAPKRRECVRVLSDVSGVAQVQSVRHRLLANDERPLAVLSDWSHTLQPDPSLQPSWLSYKSLRGGHQGTLDGFFSETDPENADAAYRKLLQVLWLLQFLSSLPHAGPVLGRDRDTRYPLVSRGGYDPSRFYTPCSWIPPQYPLFRYSGLQQPGGLGRLLGDRNALWHAPAYEMNCWGGLPGSPGGYPFCHDSGDGRLLHPEENDPGAVRPPDGARGSIPQSLLLDAGVLGLNGNRVRCNVPYRHPYHEKLRRTGRDMAVAQGEWVPCGEHLTMDIQVEEDCQYITAGGFINSNSWLGFEELTNWATPDCYDSMFSILRSPIPDIPKRVRSTCNPWGVGHCVPYGEVLTPSGWRDIDTFQPGDPVYTVTEDGRMVATTVDQVHEYDFEGGMKVVDQRGLHMACTPEHRVAKLGGTRENPGALFSLVPFKDLPGQAYVKRTVTWEGSRIDTFSPPKVETRKRRLQQPTPITGDQFVQLLGWFLSEGCVVDRDKAFCIAQTKPERREAIESLLDDCGFIYSVTPGEYTIYAPDWYAYFRQFGKSRDKFIPEDVKRASPDQLALLLESLIAGDGHRSKQRKGRGAFYYTMSKRLAEDVEEIALKCGLAVYTSQREREGRQGLAYSVSLKEAGGGTEILTGNHQHEVDTQTQDPWGRRAKDVPFKGKVYCLGIEGTHSFLIKQKGAVWVSGNSWVKKYFIDAGPPGVPIIQTFTNPITHESISRTRSHIFGSIFENKHLIDNDPQYLANLMTIQDEAKRKAWLEGSWDVMPGGFFGDLFDRRRNVLPAFTPPKDWECFLSFDWGSASPFSLGVWTIADGQHQPIPNKVLPRGAVIRFDEWYGADEKTGDGLRMINGELGARIVARVNNWMNRGLRFSSGVADPSIWIEEGGPSIYAQMKKGIDAAVEERKIKIPTLFKPADNARIPGWQQMRERIYNRKDDRAMLYVTDNCVDWLRTVPMLPRDEDNWDDVDTDTEDHAADDTRYACMRVSRRLHVVKLSGL